MTAFAILFTMAAIGIAETAYLIKTRKADEKPICPIGGDCQIVLTSKYNKTFWIHNDILGFLFYLTMAVLTALVVIGVEPLPLWNIIIVIAETIAVIMSLVFIYLQWRIIKAWCTWCLLSALTILVMAVVLATKGLIIIF